MDENKNGTKKERTQTQSELTVQVLNFSGCMVTSEVLSSMPKREIVGNYNWNNFYVFFDVKPY